jgi:hypothetical protein
VPADALTLIVTNSSSTNANGLTTLPSISTPSAGGNPQINAVAFRESASGYTLTINGNGFGMLPRKSLPFRGVTSFFRLNVPAQLGAGEWGFSGDARALVYKLWSDTEVQIGGFTARPGDALDICLWNSASGKGGTWGGNIPGGVGTPHIGSVAFSGEGRHFHMIVRGKGFGSAPVAMPYTGDLNCFSFIDFRTHCNGASSLFEAGASRWQHGSPNSLTLNYQSWSDTEIVINGFSGSYGQGCNALTNGDPVTIIVWNSSASDQTGPQTAWGGFVDNTSIPTLPDGTGGKIRILSGTGTFVTVSDSNDIVNVSAGATLKGTINLSVLNLGPAYAVAPLIYTPSWGDNSSSWRLIKRSVPIGLSDQHAHILLVAPTTPGVYHIIFAVSWELTGDQVASMTDFNLGHSVWKDGNDIAEFNTAQLSSAQINGWAFDKNLQPTANGPGYVPRPIPADAITLVVGQR